MTRIIVHLMRIKLFVMASLPLYKMSKLISFIINMCCIGTAIKMKKNANKRGGRGEIPLAVSQHQGKTPQN